MKIKNAEFITSVADSKLFLRSEKPIIAIVGKSNVGKSSFINMLANQKKLAKTSDTPGRTRLVNYFDFGEFIIADLPGYGYAKVSKEEKDKWARVMEDFFADKQNADYVFSLVDIRHNPTVDDMTMINCLHKYAFSYCVIATKADKISRLQVKTQLQNIAKVFKMTDASIIATSSETRQGLDEVLQKLEVVLNALKVCDKDEE